MSSSKVRPNVPGYQVMDLLGVGARSTIWRVRHRRTSNLYALKRVYREVVDDSRFINQALNEFRVARHFDHPAIRRYERLKNCLLYTSPSPRDRTRSRMPSSA